MMPYATPFSDTFSQKTANAKSLETPINTHYLTESAPPSFTGKERDEETGFSYYGARYYAPDVSTLFLSADPYADKYPGISPYAYCAWNPVKYVDPNGEFGIPTHLKLVFATTKHIGLSIKRLQILYGTSWVSDVKRSSQSKVHMDNLNPAKMGKNVFSSIKSIFQNAFNKYSYHMDNEKYIEAGVDLHTIADFYSHSNYVELYQKYNGDAPLNKNDIPLFSEVMENTEKYSGFIQLLNSELKTGLFESFGKDFLSTDDNKHFNMSHDGFLNKMRRKKFQGVRGGKYAESLARRETAKIIEQQ